ncbi:MAG: HAMP domain-containing sensor histidine kinase, partial [Cyanobacteria bacterium P01_H01_bin.15]
QAAVQLKNYFGLAGCVIEVSALAEKFLVGTPATIPDYWSALFRAHRHLLLKRQCVVHCSHDSWFEQIWQRKLSVSGIGSLLLYFLPHVQGVIALYHHQSDGTWTQPVRRSLCLLAEQLPTVGLPLLSKISPLSYYQKLSDPHSNDRKTIKALLAQMGKLTHAGQVLLWRSHETKMFVHQWRHPKLADSGTIDRPHLSLSLDPGFGSLPTGVEHFRSDPKLELKSTSVHFYPKAFMTFPVYSQTRHLGTLLFIDIAPWLVDKLSIIMKPLLGPLALAWERDLESDRLAEAVKVRTEQLEAEAEAAQQISEAKGQYLSMVNHELRTPLASVLGFARLLGEEIYGPLNEKQHQYVKAITESGEFLLELVSDLLDLSKLEAHREELYWETVAIADLCQAALSFVAAWSEKEQIALNLEIDSSLGVCCVDQRRWKQILLNLLSNALKFTPAQGQITLRVSPLKGGIAFSIIDTGVGIETNNLNKLFEPFAQIRNPQSRKYRGTGLGLPLSRELARLHGGDLTVVSTPGQGSCFTAWLPPMGCSTVGEVPDQSTLGGELGA